jgi:hypothetical protein
VILVKIIKIKSEENMMEREESKLIKKFLAVQSSNKCLMTFTESFVAMTLKPQMTTLTKKSKKRLFCIKVIQSRGNLFKTSFPSIDSFLYLI